MIEILYQDDDLIAVNKPAGLAVHRSKMVGNACCVSSSVAMFIWRIGWIALPAACC